MKKRTIKSIRKSCETLWSKIIRTRDKVCKRCGEPNTLNAHHIYGKSTLKLRFCLDNGITLCASCHKWATDSIHNMPKKKINLDLIDKHLTKQKQNMIVKLGNELSYNMSVEDYLDIEKDLKEKLEEL
jgi:hypothetical protein